MNYRFIIFIIVIAYVLLSCFTSNNNYDNKKVFITFGGGGTNYVNAGKRIVRQVQETGLFDDQILYTDRDLKNDEYFWDKHRAFIESNPRGYGYWLWKPYIIMKEMEKLKDGDVILYADSGCEIAGENVKNIPRLFDKVSKPNHITLTSTWLSEKSWSKMDIFDFFNCLDDSQLQNSDQVQASLILFSVNDDLRKVISQWYEVMSENYNLIDDTPSIIENDPEFQENRHDQSILSFVLKTNKHITYDTEFGNDDLSPFGIHLIRNRTGNYIYEKEKI